MAEPILKWLGGKREQLREIMPLIQKNLNGTNKYLEPFVGGGSIAFSLNYNNILINDLNSELINLYLMVKDNLSLLVEELEELQYRTTPEYYYHIRNLDRNLENFNSLSNSFKAARTLYLNKMCFNGLYRVNQKGQFNSPIGRTSSGKPPQILDLPKLEELSDFLNCGVFKICNLDYAEFLSCYAAKGDVIYLDPPYDYASGEGFTSYQKDGWTSKDTEKLADLCNTYKQDLGCHLIISNNDTPLIRDLFTEKSGWQIKEISTRRNINCKGDGRNTGREVIIYC